jgi:hypothetical protein
MDVVGYLGNILQRFTLKMIVIHVVKKLSAFVQ